jgi:hypothetical protein
MSLPTEQEPQQQAKFNDGQFCSTTNLRKRKATKTTTIDIPLVFEMQEILKRLGRAAQGNASSFVGAWLHQWKQIRKILHHRRLQGQVWKRQPNNFLQDDDETTNRFH